MSSKRRRASERNVMSIEPVSSDEDQANTSSSPQETAPTNLALLKPKLDEIPKLVLMELQSESPEDIIEVLDRLSDLLWFKDGDVPTREMEKRRKDVLYTGACGHVVLCLRRWPTNVMIQSFGCKCLARLMLACETDAACAVAQSGGVEIILNAMKRFPKEHHVQRSGCLALMNAFKDLEPYPILHISYGFVEELEGLDIVQNAMEEFSDSPTLIKLACGLLYNLALKRKFHLALVKAGTVPVVGEALENHIEDKRVRAIANGFLKLIITSENTWSTQKQLRDDGPSVTWSRGMLRRLEDIEKEATLRLSIRGSVAASSPNVVIP